LLAWQCHMTNHTDTRETIFALRMHPSSFQRNLFLL